MTTLADAAPVPDSGQAIAIENLTKDYGDVHALRGIDVSVERGEVFGFLGPNGAGKSTAIRCLLDLLRPTSGRIEVLGLSPRRDGVAIRTRVGYVPGELRLPERTTGLQLVESIARIRGGVDVRRRDELVERLEIDLARPTRQLSSGNRRKLALLLAFMPRPELLILDEPTAGLDPLVQHTFLELVREERDAGTTVFLSSHILSEVQRIADHVVVLRAGQVVAHGTVADLRGQARQRVEIWFGTEPPEAALRSLPELSGIEVDRNRVSAVLSGPVQGLLGFLAGQAVDHLLIEEPDLEEAFLDLYGDDKEPAGTAGVST